MVVPAPSLLWGGDVFTIYEGGIVGRSVGRVFSFMVVLVKLHEILTLEVMLEGAIR